MSVCITRKNGARACGNDWNSDYWRSIAPVTLEHFGRHSSDHRPDVRVRLAYDDEGIALCYRVDDRYTLSVCTDYMGKVHLDSCVEFFFFPANATGYFNFETNMGGTLHASYIRDCERYPDGHYVDWTPLAPEHGSMALITPSHPGVTSPEDPQPRLWFLSIFIPFACLAPYCGAEVAAGRVGWRGNVYKCAGRSSHPHWASLYPLSTREFHTPGDYGPFVFD